MELHVVDTSGAKAEADVLVVPAFEDKNPFAGYDYGSEMQGHFERHGFTGKNGELLLLCSGAIKAHTVVAVGLGKKGDFSAERLRNAVCSAVRNDVISKAKHKNLAVDLNILISTLGKGKESTVPGGAKSGPKLSFARWAGQAAAEGAVLGAYQFDQLLSKDSDKRKHRPTSVTLVAPAKANKDLKKGWEDGVSIAEQVNFCRDLANMPNNLMKPGQLARAARDMARKTSDLDCTILEKGKLEQLKMGAFLSVNAGSDDGDGAARLIVLEYKGGKKDQAPLCFVGKGLTFDTGGYSLKPADGMLGMKWDMAGAATVIAAIGAIARLKLPINVVAIAPTTENLVNENATKPGDVVTSMKGLTIEVNNTDAEGRLALCDALTYAQQEYKPDTIIDVATLTGAVLIALGDQVFGVMANDDGVAKEVEQASANAAEPSWRLPLPKEYESYMDGTIGDLANISGGRAAGTVTAGIFLKKFIDNGQKWAHLDIAAVASNDSGKQKGVAPAKGCTGNPVRTLVALARARANA